MTNNLPKIIRTYFQVKVDDLLRAKEFYQETFGFDVAYFEGANIGWAEMQLPGEARLGLNLRRPDENKPKSWGILTVEVENIEASWEYFKQKGTTPTEIYDNPNNISFFNIKDSEGNDVQIVSEPRIKD